MWALPVNLAELVPVPVKVIVVACGLEVQIRCGFRRVAQISAVLISSDVVVFAGSVTVIGMAAHIGLGKPQIALIGIKIRITIFEFQSLFEQGIRFPKHLQHGLIALKARVPAGMSLNVTKSVTVLVIHFQQVAEAPVLGVNRITVINMPGKAVVRTVDELAKKLFLLRHRRGQIVDHSSRGVRAVFDLTRALEDFKGTHSTGIG